VSRPVKVAFASCKPDLTEAFVRRFAELAPEFELYVVSEFPPPAGRWIPYRVGRSYEDNVRRCASALRGCTVRLGGLVLQPGAPYGRLRLLALRFARHRTLVFNPNLDHFSLRPHSLPSIARHVGWRLRERVVYQINPGGDLYTWLWRLRHPSQLRRPLSRVAALAAGRVAARRRSRGGAETILKDVGPQRREGISVVIPSRNGRHLLARLLPRIVDDASEIVIVDNGSDDGTADWLKATYPSVIVETEAQPLSFARAVNRGIRRAQGSHVCLLNNDMLPAPGFLRALRAAFDAVPDLFCATAQIFFPEGKRREETGKAVIRAVQRPRTTTEFPVHCIEPLPGEDGSYVLYGSGGCSLYDTSKLLALGGIDEIYEPAYVEDLDVGVRAWQQGWPTVFVAGAHTVHDHRATTSRYYSESELNRVLERNWLRCLARTVNSPRVFRPRWRDAVERLNLKAALEHDGAAADVLAEAADIALASQPRAAGGDVAVFPGRSQRHENTVLVASCYSPFPLSHGGAVRMYNLMRRAACDLSQVLITFVEELHTPPAELLAICVEIVQVKRHGSHVRRDSGRPDVVEEFDSSAFRAALRQTIAKWSPSVAQLEFTQMAQYARDCRPARSILVEHDITLDLYRQLVRDTDDYDMRQQLPLWERFEQRAWSEVDCVVVMSEKDRQTVRGARHVEVLANGVDLDRFRPAECEPDPARLLFIGSFAHLPNLLALDFFLRDVWPKLRSSGVTLHVIAGSRHEYFFERWRDRLSFRLDAPGLEVEGFVSDVRDAYGRATVVIAPLLASAGTNIKITEALAMGKAVVSTSGGVNGLHELTSGFDVVVEDDPQRMAAALDLLLRDAGARRELERNARATAERVYDWNDIAAKQQALYRRLTS
jgi:GT2 family glycosyltransferase/glycosyltransferase involved in cell wall biosynthesis